MHTLRRFLAASPLWLDLTALAVLLSLALALRLPNFMTVPPITDEYKGPSDLSARLGPAFPLRTVLRANYPCAACGTAGDFSLFDWDRPGAGEAHAGP